MTATHVTTKSNMSKVAILAGLATMLGACQSSNLWQGEEVLVEARQTVLERDVGNVSENHRELKDRFNALERLYVDLARNMRMQNEQLSSIEQKLANFQKDPEVDASLKRVRNELQAVRKDMKDMENRIYSVEVTDRQAAYLPPAKTEAAPTGTSQSGADASSSAPDASAGAAAAATPTPVDNRAPVDNRTYYGAHLASYRSKDQVASGWGSLLRAFSGELEDMKPLIYTQSQEGIGTFLRLIVGPLESEAQAEELCNRIRETGGEQYCRVSEYQGEPIG
jgi:TolA-binding protein